MPAVELLVAARAALRDLARHANHDIVHVADLIDLYFPIVYVGGDGESSVDALKVLIAAILEECGQTVVLQDDMLSFSSLVPREATLADENEAGAIWYLLVKERLIHVLIKYAKIAHRVHEAPLEVLLDSSRVQL